MYKHAQSHKCFYVFCVMLEALGGSWEGPRGFLGVAWDHLWAFVSWRHSGPRRGLPESFSKTLPRSLQDLSRIFQGPPKPSPSRFRGLPKALLRPPKGLSNILSRFSPSPLLKPFQGPSKALARPSKAFQCPSKAVSRLFQCPCRCSEPYWWSFWYPNLHS